MNAQQKIAPDFSGYEVGYDIPALPGMNEADIQTPCLILDLDDAGFALVRALDHDAGRVAPVGIAYPFGNPTALGDAVHESCMVTHDTRQGWEGATLVAAAASAGVDGYSTRDAVVAAIELVESLPERGHWAAKASVLARSKEAVRGIRHRTGAEQLDYLRDVVGTSVDSTESVPAALAIAYEFADDPMTGLYTAANLGGDTDTIAAMAGAIFGATHGTEAFDTEAVRTVEEVSHLELCSIRDGLLELRAGRL